MLIPTWLSSAPALEEVLHLDKAVHAKRRQLVVGNWKMNGNRQTQAELIQKFIAGWPQVAGDVEVVVCPAFPYLPMIAEAVADTGVLVGGQNLSEYTQGAYTGEVSAAMLLDWQCRYVIIGHNERRRLQQESDARVAQKFVAAQGAGLIPILCVGESSAQREAGETIAVIGRQLDAVLSAVGLDALANAVLAYEPIWAVGTGQTATPEQAQSVHQYMRGKLGELGSQVRILYGGSVKASNAAELFAKEDIDGALLGGASLDADEFLSICRIAGAAG